MACLTATLKNLSIAMTDYYVLATASSSDTVILAQVQSYAKLYHTLENQQKLISEMSAYSLLWWGGIRSFYEAIPTIHWRQDYRLTEGVLRFRVLCLPHLVYPSVGWVKLFQLDSSRCQTLPWLGLVSIEWKASHDRVGFR